MTRNDYSPRMENKKEPLNSPFSYIVIYPLSFYRLSHIQTRKLTVLSQKLPAGFRDNTVSFRVRIRVLPDSTQPVCFG